MFRILRETVGVYLGWTVLHWSFVNMYAYVCAPSGGWGLVKTIIASQNTHCSMIRTATLISGANMDQSLSVALTWFLMRLGGMWNRPGETLQPITPS